ncbi:Fibrillarin-like rRNA methylase [Archaeoglobus fulgidus DSM 8774]|uniref:Fibrillarin-like rRNA/tRNA 2'-O-methyltransferase n=1 Tax=Archaeoglobus fulgidus DSM 8774 TaxID=1344584 RepID=A0A075WGG2_ARCFL|nr:fibrillarin-like rRNA/tRNA 2'-O-methyltransferase [Archaeoglobus fulgidus]AIG99076.1 Fibrillarin-like rRNA methylase [Archaeoglobus fulgidus DSM 8774]
MKELMRNVYLLDDTLVTKSKYGSHYGEKVFDGYREWVPWRSKLAAMILKGHRLKLRGDERVLYLGAASGATVSHLADIVDEGIIYAVEYSAKPFEKLLELVRERNNIIPLLFDASKPWKYSGIVEKVDLIYQDIAQKNQIEILKANAEFFLKEKGEVVIMVKARSIDSTAEPEEVFKSVLKEMEGDFKIVKHGSLMPYHRDHIFIHAYRF